MHDCDNISSASYIVVVCSDNANPKHNKIQLRTDPPTFIELQPGKNVLTVEQYPDLENGFSQIDEYELDANDPDCQNEYNCGDVISVDLSHFDPSEMTTMDWMFRRMENLTTIDFGDIHINNVTSMDSTFEWIAAKELNLTNIDFTQVTNAEMMTYCKERLKVILTGCDLSRVESADDIFSGVTYLNLDRTKLSDEVIDAMGWWHGEGGCENLEEISMRGCDVQLIESVIRQLLTGKTENFHFTLIC